MLLILIALASFVIWLYYTLPKKHFKRLIIVLAIVSLWSIVWLGVLQTELQAGGMTTGTYGSDADYYYQGMQEAFYSDNPAAAISNYFNGFYIKYGVLVLKTSPCFGILWVKLANILLLIMSLGFAYVILWRTGVPLKIASLIVLLAGLNGIVTWMSIRNLKDTLFLFLMLFDCLIAVTAYYRLKGKKIILYLLYLSLLTFISWVLAGVFGDLRQWAFVIPWLILAGLIATILLDNKTIYQYRFLLGGIAIGLALVFVQAYLGHQIINFGYYASENGLGNAKGINLILGLGVGLLRFFVGPGPIRAIMGNDVFLVTNHTGNILIFLGSLMWWGTLPLLAIRFKEIVKMFFHELIVILPLLLYIAIYVYVYQGSVETRFRAVLYVMCLLVLGLTYVYPKPGNQRNYKIAYVLWGLVVVIAGSIASFLSLA